MPQVTDKHKNSVGICWWQIDILLFWNLTLLFITRLVLYWNKISVFSYEKQGSVRQLLHEKIRDAYTHPQFVTDVMKPLQIENIIDQEVF